MAVIQFSTARAAHTIHSGKDARPTTAPQVVSFAQAKAMRELPTYLRGGRI